MSIVALSVLANQQTKSNLLKITRAGFGLTKINPICFKEVGPNPKHCKEVSPLLNSLDKDHIPLLCFGLPPHVGVKRGDHIALIAAQESLRISYLLEILEHMSPRFAHDRSTPLF